MLDLKLRAKPSKYDRIQRINKEIQRIEETVYPDGYGEIKTVIKAALEDRIECILDGKV